MQKVISLDVYNDKNEYMGEKRFYTEAYKERESINKLAKELNAIQGDTIALIVSASPDFQHNQQLAILSRRQERYCFAITQNNLIPFSVYFAVRHAIKATWLNDRDQFLYPRPRESIPVIVRAFKPEAIHNPPTWEEDSEFQNDCLAFTLFHSQNRITSRVDSTNGGANHFIPFSEKEVGAKEAFNSHFMHDFINGKIKLDCFTSYEVRNDDSSPVIMSERESSLCHCDTSSRHCNPPYRHSEALAEESKSIESKDISHSLNMTESKKILKDSSPFDKNPQNDKVGFSNFTKAHNDKKDSSFVSSAHNDSTSTLFSPADLGLQSKSFIPTKPLVFSKEAQDVFETGLKVWQYYHKNFEKIPEIHAQHNDDFYRIYNANASLYDIKGYFQGFTQSKKGRAKEDIGNSMGIMNNKSKMNAKSLDTHYNDLIAELKFALETLAKKIEPRIYEYGFLLE